MYYAIVMTVEHSTNYALENLRHLVLCQIRTTFERFIQGVMHEVHDDVGVRVQRRRCEHFVTLDDVCVPQPPHNFGLCDYFFNFFVSLRRLKLLYSNMLSCHLVTRLHDRGEAATANIAIENVILIEKVTAMNILTYSL